MQKISAATALLLLVAVGCAGTSPVTTVVACPTPQITNTDQQFYDERYRLWGEWTLYFPESRDRVDVIPRRDSQAHLNVLKWLEGDCTDCLEITDVFNNGDSTINLTVQIRHPKPTKPEFTGFDVKGIIMFNGSYELPSVSPFAPYPDDFLISWSELGDPEILNPDGYTVRWSPSYVSGSNLPLLNYYPGKYANASSTANLNAYLDFYTTEERHIFNVYGVTSREYHIYLPEGPVSAGYAIEACWFPPDNFPVNDPVNDFPVSANQEEPYFLNLVVNNGETFTEQEYCCGCNVVDDPCGDLHLESEQWGPQDDDHFIDAIFTLTPEPYLNSHAYGMGKCPNPDEDWFQLACTEFNSPTVSYPDGDYLGLVIVWRSDLGPPPDFQIFRTRVGYTLIHFSVDIE